jgi:hypothetical protein
MKAYLARAAHVLRDRAHILSIEIEMAEAAVLAITHK